MRYYLFAFGFIIYISCSLEEERTKKERECKEQIPQGKMDCLQYSDADLNLTCCLGTFFIDEDKTQNNIYCYPVELGFEFSLYYFDSIPFNYEGTQYTSASFQCMEDLEDEPLTAEDEAHKNSCGTGSPTKLFQCREHSNNKNTCCMINQDGKTDCILADSKFGNVSTLQTFFDVVTVECDSFYYTYKTLLIFHIIPFLLFFIISFLYK